MLNIGMSNTNTPVFFNYNHEHTIILNAEKAKIFDNQTDRLLIEM